MSEFDYGAANRRIAEKLGEAKEKCGHSKHWFTLLSCSRQRDMCPADTDACVRRTYWYPDYAHDPAATLRLEDYIITIGTLSVEWNDDCDKTEIAITLWDDEKSGVEYNGYATYIGEALVQAYDHVLKEGA